MREREEEEFYSRCCALIFISQTLPKFTYMLVLEANCSVVAPSLGACMMILTRFFCSMYIAPVHR